MKKSQYIYLQFIIFLPLDSFMHLKQQKKSHSLIHTATPQWSVEKKQASSSVSKIHISRSNSVRVEEKKIIQKVIEEINNEQSRFVCILRSFEAKRTIAGFKAKIEWQWTKCGLSIVLKFSFSNSYFRYINNVIEGDVIVQLDELNFDLKTQEKRDLQQKIEVVLMHCFQEMRKKSYNEETQIQSQFIKKYMCDFHNIAIEIAADRRPKKQSQKVNKETNSRHYMLYPTPVTFAWSPFGSLCVTENRFPTNRKSFIGGANTFRKYFEHSAVDYNKVINQEQQMSFEEKDTKVQSIYNWDIQNELQFLIFKKNEEKKGEEMFYHDTNRAELKSINKKEQEKKSYESVVLKPVRIESQKLKRILTRYFSQNERMTQFHRHDKLRVYDILTVNRYYQQQLIYMIERIRLFKDEKSIFQIVLQNEMSLYQSMFGTMDSLKYDLLCEHFRDQIAQYAEKGRDTFGLFLKILIIENQYFSFQIQAYFKQLYDHLAKKVHQKISMIGAYNYFDQYRAEIIFMSLVKAYIQKQNVDNVDIQTKSLEGVGGKMLIKFRPKYRIPKLALEEIISQDKKNFFLLNLLPVLIIKDREMQKLEFKQVKRIIVANSRMLQFNKKVNDILAKIEQNRQSFINQLLSSFQQYLQSQIKDDFSLIQPRRLFKIYCSKCKKFTQSYELFESEQVSFCQRCNSKNSY